jgi:hemoglobin-like flavoprotein
VNDTRQGINQTIMSLTQPQIELVKQTFELVAPNAERVAQLFYERLFEIAPSLRGMFKGDLKDQGRKLMHMLTIAVHALDHVASIVPAVQALGKRHASYGVQPEHYAIVAEALLWTLDQGLGDTFTPEVEAAWTALYTLVAQTMLAGTQMAEAV